MYKFTYDEKQIIHKITNESSDEEVDLESKHNLTQVIASIFLIQKFLGMDWYKRAFEMTDMAEIKTTMPAQIPPLSYYLGKQETEKYFKIIKFGIYLKHLAETQNFKNKITEYVREQKKSGVPSISLFDSTYFELKIACFFVRNGLDVNFIEEKTSKTPDLEITLNSDSTIVECKKKQYVKYSIESVLKSIIVANSQLEEFGRDGIVAIELAEKGDNSDFDIKELEKQIISFVNDKPFVNYVWILNEFSYEVDNLTILKTERKSIKNTNSKNQIPSSIEHVLLYGTIPPDISLLDD